jgi:site-specific DNA recombinase
LTVKYSRHRQPLRAADLLAPDVVAAAVEAYRLERAELNEKRAKAIRHAKRDVDTLDRKIAHVVQEIAEGGASRALRLSLDALEAKRDEILGRVPEPIPDSVLALHPRAADRYRQQVEDIRAALSKGDHAAHEAISLLRGLIRRIVASPAEESGPLGLTVEGDLAMMLERGANSGATSLVAGAGFEPATFRL